MHMGGELGLTGAELKRFIDEQIEIERTQINADRDDRTRTRDLEREAVNRERALENERIQQDRAALAEDRAAEADRETRQREHELAMRRLELEGQAGGTPGQAAGADATVNVPPGRYQGLRLPFYDDTRDSIDAFLHRFQIFATSQNWPVEVWSQYLSSLLKGRALETYSRLPVQDALNYEKVKDALLRRFELTEAGFKSKFYESKAEQGESPREFLARLDFFFTRWSELAGCPQTYLGLKDFILREQYLSSCSSDLTIFLKERKPKSVEDMAALAESFLDARIQPKKETGKSATEKGKKVNSGDDKSQPGSNSKQPVKSEGASPSTKVTCYICNKVGHIAKNCRSRPVQKTAAVVNAVGNINPRANPVPMGNYVCRSHGMPGFCQYCFVNPMGDNGPTVGAFLVEQNPENCDNRPACTFGASVDNQPTGLPVTTGKLGDIPVQVLRDTGCSTVIVRQSLIKPNQYTGQTQVCRLVDGTLRKVPCIEVNLQSSFFTGVVKGVGMKAPLFDVIVGNVKGATMLSSSAVKTNNVSNLKMSGKISAREAETQTDFSGIKLSQASLGETNKFISGVDKSAAVVTRSQSVAQAKPLKPLKVADINKVLTSTELAEAQKSDKSLIPLWNRCRDKTITSFRGRKSWFETKRGLLYRKSQISDDETAEIKSQLVLPSCAKKVVLSLSHSGNFAGHLAFQKSLDRVVSQFFWPGIGADVKRFCRSCDICQRTIPKGRVTKVPLGTMPLIDIPFSRVIIDLVGPIFPTSGRGHRYILTAVCSATRYPEAVPLKHIDTITVAEALMGIWARVGVPRELQSDQGTQFTSDVMKEVCRLLSIKQLISSPYNAKCQGLTEKFNGTLKQMLKKMCADKPSDWDRYLPALLFAYREVPQASLGFSPFEMLYGRAVRGPVSILKELWSKEEVDPETKTSYQYVLELSQKLQDTCQLAHENLAQASKKAMTYYNRKTKARFFKEGDRVLLLLPTNNNKLLLTWKGPFLIKERVNDMDYRVDLGHKTRMFHANLLKLYVERETNALQPQVDGSFCDMAGSAVVELEKEEDGAVSDLDLLSLPNSMQKETYRDVKIGDNLTDGQRAEVENLLAEFRIFLATYRKLLI